MADVFSCVLWNFKCFCLVIQDIFYLTKLCGILHLGSPFNLPRADSGRKIGSTFWSQMRREELPAAAIWSEVKYTIFPVISGNTKENTKAPRHWALWGEFTGDRWIPLTKGQQRGKCFHLMTSPWYYHSATSFSSVYSTVSSGVD